jgi:hypothetical protein
MSATDTGRARADNLANPYRRSLFAAAASALVARAAIARAVHGTIVGIPADDAELIRLGALFEDAWNVESLAWIDYEELAAGAPGERAVAEIAERAFGRTSAIVDQIEAIPARTLPGLLVKRRALAWCVSGETFTIEDLDCNASPTTDMRLIVGMLADMTAIESGLT